MHIPYYDIYIYRTMTILGFGFSRPRLDEFRVSSYLLRRCPLYRPYFFVCRRKEQMEIEIAQSILILKARYNLIIIFKYISTTKFKIKNEIIHLEVCQFGILLFRSFIIESIIIVVDKVVRPNCNGMV